MQFEYGVKFPEGPSANYHVPNVTSLEIYIVENQVTIKFVQTDGTQKIINQEFTNIINFGLQK